MARSSLPLRKSTRKGAVPTCASGETSPASATGPAGENSGRKKLKTLGDLYVCCPIRSSKLRRSISMPLFATYSIDRSR